MACCVSVYWIVYFTACLRKNLSLSSWSFYFYSSSQGFFSFLSFMRWHQQYSAFSKPLTLLKWRKWSKTSSMGVVHPKLYVFVCVHLCALVFSLQPSLNTILFVFLIMSSRDSITIMFKCKANFICFCCFVSRIQKRCV